MVKPLPVPATINFAMQASNHDQLSEIQEADKEEESNINAQVLQDDDMGYVEEEEGDNDLDKPFELDGITTDEELENLYDKSAATELTAVKTVKSQMVKKSMKNNKVVEIPEHKRFHDHFYFATFTNIYTSDKICCSILQPLRTDPCMQPEDCSNQFCEKCQSHA